MATCIHGKTAPDLNLPDCESGGVTRWKCPICAYSAGVADANKNRSWKFPKSCAHETAPKDVIANLPEYQGGGVRWRHKCAFKAYQLGVDAGKTNTSSTPATSTPQNLDSEQEDSDSESIEVFEFKPGHKKVKEGQANAAAVGTPVTRELKHNKIQNKLYEILSKTYGDDNVRTEQPTGSSGTAVDLVLKEDDEFTFFEIKTSPSVRECIRQAISQLLEYAYWPEDNRANKLVIVSEVPATSDAKKYIKKLRKDFDLPIFYAQIDMEQEKLIIFPETESI